MKSSQKISKEKKYTNRKIGQGHSRDILKGIYINGIEHTYEKCPPSSDQITRN